MGPDLDSPCSSRRGGLCERTGTSLYKVAGFSRKKFSKTKSEKETLHGCLGNSPAAATLASSPPSCVALPPGWHRKYSHLKPQGECAPKLVGPEAAGELGCRLAKWEKSETNTPSACCSQEDQQNWLGQSEASRRLFFVVFFFFY